MPQPPPPGRPSSPAPPQPGSGARAPRSPASPSPAGGRRHLRTGRGPGPGRRRRGRRLGGPRWTRSGARLGPGGGRSPGALAPRAHGREPRGAGGAAARGCSGLELLPAPPPRAGTARSDVSAAPPAPAPPPDQCGMEGAEASGEGRSARLPRAASRPFPGSRGAIRALHPPPAPPGAPGAAAPNLGASRAALSSAIRAALGRRERRPDWGRGGGPRLLSGLKRGRFNLSPTKVMGRLRASTPDWRIPGRGSPPVSSERML